MPDDDAGDGGSRRWQEDVEPDLRRRVLDRVIAKLEQVYAGRPSHELNRIAASFEDNMFNKADSKADYIKKISHKVHILDRSRQSLPEHSSGPNQQTKMGQQMQRDNTIQARHGSNSSSTAMPQVSPTMSSHEGQPPHMRSLPITPSGSSSVNMAYPVILSDQILKSSPSIDTPSSSGVHPSELMMQRGESRNQNKLPAMQMQPINFSSGSAASVAQSQGQPVVQPNWQQNLRQNARGTGMLPQQQLRMNQQGLEVNQHKMSGQNSQMVVAEQANVAKMQIGHPREQNNQQNAELNVGSPQQTYQHINTEPNPMVLPQQLITVNQQSNLHSEIPQPVASMESVEEVDWREEMFQQIKALKDAYLSELVELDQASVVPRITKEHFESLPKDQAEHYRFRVYMKKKIKIMLTFLQLQKSTIPDHLSGQLPVYVKNIQNVLDFYRRKKDQSAEMDEGRQSQISYKKPEIIDLTGDSPSYSGSTSSQKEQPVAFHLRQNIATRTPAASREDHSNILPGVASSCAPVISRGSVQSLPSNNLQDYRTPSAVTKESPVQVSSASASGRTIFSSPVVKPMECTASPVTREDYVSSAAAAETPVAKRPIERLKDAVRSISPTALRSAVHSMASVFGAMDDLIPHGEFNTFQQGTFFSKYGGSCRPNRIKRIFEMTAPCPDHDANRQKTQNARNALLDEIESANSMLIDTIASISDDNITDGITSSSGGTLIILSYTAVSLAPNLKSLFATSETPVIMPKKLLVPADYPRSSPVPVNEHRSEQPRNMFSNISDSADMAFRDTLNGMPEPRSIKETVRAWDAGVRRAILEFVQWFGGGTFSSTYGRWESCGGA